MIVNLKYMWTILFIVAFIFLGLGIIYFINNG